MVKGFETGLFLFGLVGDLVDTVGVRGGVVSVAIFINELLEFIKMSRESGVVRDEIGEISGDVVKTDRGSENVVNVVAKAVGSFKVGIILIAAELGAKTSETGAYFHHSVTKVGVTMGGVMFACWGVGYSVCTKVDIASGAVPVEASIDEIFGVGKFATEDTGVLGFEDGIVGIGVEFVGEIDAVIYVFKVNSRKSGDEFA